MTIAFVTGQQAILLLNRRGYNTAVSCCQCGYVFTCPSCSVSHDLSPGQRADDVPLLRVYPGSRFRFVPNVVRIKFAMLDWVPSGWNRSWNVYFPGNRFCGWILIPLCPASPMRKSSGTSPKENTGLMIGTQMVAKGLDFPRGASGGRAVGGSVPVWWAIFAALRLRFPC